MSSECLHVLNVGKNASLLVWKTSYHDVYGMYYGFVMGMWVWIMSKKKTFCLEKNVGNYRQLLTVTINKIILHVQVHRLIFITVVRLKQNYYPVATINEQQQ